MATISKNYSAITPRKGGFFQEQDEFLQVGFYISLFCHLILLGLLFLELNAGFGQLKPPVIYSVTLEGGKTIGGIAQVAKNDKTMIAPPKKVQSEPKKEEASEKKPEVKEEPKPKEEPKKVEPEKNTVKIPDKKAPEKKVEDKKKDLKKPKEETQADINKKQQDAVQRYLGESSNAGGTGFGAAALGGKAMGGGVQRPPEFFTYSKILEDYIKAGWRWTDTSSPLIAQVTFDMTSDGRISNVTVIKGSGSREFDDSTVRAIEKASPVPAPPASVYDFFKSVRMTFDPRE